MNRDDMLAFARVLSFSAVVALWALLRLATSR
jgi:hypothetical protein